MKSTRGKFPLLPIAAVGGAIAAVAAVNTWLSWNAGALESSLPGKGRFYHWQRGPDVFNIYYKVAGEGKPVVLIHGVDSAASSEEMRPVAEGLQGKRKVFALDLLGFGVSDRPNRGYSRWDYLDLIEDFLRDVVAEPAAVIATGLSAAYAVTVASRSPELISNLVLICPTGLERLADVAPEQQQQIGALLRVPILGSAFYNLLSSRAALSYFLKGRTYGNPELVTDEVLAGYYRTTHQDGARHAPSAFLSGALNLSIRETYPELTQPVFIVWGREAQTTPVSDANLFIRSRPKSRLKVLDGCGLLPHVERPAEFLAVADQALAMVPEGDRT